MEDVKLKKYKESISKIYYNLFHKGRKIGKGWIRKKQSYIKKGMYLYIDSKYRQKGYGTILYNLLISEISARDISYIILNI